jgi:hypothetical protein
VEAAATLLGGGRRCLVGEGGGKEFGWLIRLGAFRRSGVFRPRLGAARRGRLSIIVVVGRPEFGGGCGFGGVRRIVYLGRTVPCVHDLLSI